MSFVKVLLKDDCGEFQNLIPTYRPLKSPKIGHKGRKKCEKNLLCRNFFQKQKFSRLVGLSTISHKFRLQHGLVLLLMIGMILEGRVGLGHVAVVIFPAVG